ncbi:hypothetical protein SAMD00079811_22400 [Scytonema sp. HK-05]|nr:hypothetical protein SAMD00079811_22400 [Scytonema sp. HK-05]
MQETAVAVNNLEVNFKDTALHSEGIHLIIQYLLSILIHSVNFFLNSENSS